MKTALHRFGLSTGIALAVLAMAAVPTGVAAVPSLPTSRRVGTEESESKSRGDKSSPASQFLTAYNSMSLADWLKEKGMLAEAADLYTEALDLFNKLAADDPQWQPAVVSFRITYCRAELQNLQKADGGQPAHRSPLGEGGTPDARHQAPDRKKMEDSEQAPDDGLPAVATNAARAKAGRQTAEDSLKRTPDAGRQTTENQKSEISNRQSENLSPLNLKLQQAALRERGRDYTGALAIYIALLEEFPRESWALKGAGRCCLRLGNMDRARALTRQALTLPSPDADMYLLAALVGCYDGRYPAAVILLRQSLKLNGANPEAHAALGVALAATGQLQQAQEEMKRALSLNPKLGAAYYNLARLSLWQKPTDRDTARVHYQNALRHGATPDPELDALLAE